MRTDNQFEEAWDLLKIAAAAEATITEITNGAGPMDCEITESSTARWYLVRTYPGDDVRALRWLARRRFGTFSPQQQRRVRSRGGVLVQGWESVFPGWLFVFTWDIERMKTRIESCPGVMGLFCYPESNRPVPIGQAFIDEMRALSWVYNEHAPRAGHYAVSGARHARRISKASIGRKERRELQRLKNEIKRVGIWDDEQWKRANELEPGKRIALLKATSISLAATGGSASART
jgi:transcription antitermination factor NusG